MPSHTQRVTPQDFAKWKTLLRYITMVKLWYSFCCCEVNNFQSFLYFFSIHERAPFWGFFGPYSPKYCSILLKFWQDLVSNKTNTVFVKYFKILNFSSNETHPKFTVLVHFGAQFTAGKPKILLKTKTSAKTASFGMSYNISPRSQKNHRRVIKNSHIVYNRTIPLYVLNSKFQFLSSTLPRRNNTFFGSGPNWAHFWGVWGQ